MIFVQILISCKLTFEQSLNYLHKKKQVLSYLLFRFRFKTSYLAVLIPEIPSFLINSETIATGFKASFGFDSLPSLFTVAISASISHVGCPYMMQVTLSLGTET